MGTFGATHGRRLVMGWGHVVDWWAKQTYQLSAQLMTTPSVLGLLLLCPDLTPNAQLAS